MTREEAKKAAEVMMAYADGKEIEMRDRARKPWTQIKAACFNWELFDYRIKPKPKPRFDPKTLQPFDKVLVRDEEEEQWSCAFYSHIRDKTTYKYATTDYSHIFCIPYNDDTKHLVGTTEEAPVYYRYWED